MKSVVFYSSAILVLVLQLVIFVSAHDPSPLQDFCVAIDEPNHYDSAG